LKPLREAVLEKALNFGPVNGSSQWQCCNWQDTVKQFLDRKLITEMEHPPLPLIWLRMASGLLQK
jgi:hypothetical protein